jgi:hypothetical protein
MPPISQIFLCSCQLSQTQRLRYLNCNFFHYLYGSETSSLTLGDGYQLRKFEYVMLRYFVPIKPSTTDLATHGAGK